MKKLLILFMFTQIAIVNAQVIGNGIGVLKKKFNLNSDANVPSGYYSLNAPVNGPTNDIWQHLVTFRHVNPDGYALQLNAPYFQGNRLFFRTVKAGKFNQWLEVATKKENIFYGSQIINGDSEASKTPLEVISGKTTNIVANFICADKTKRFSIERVEQKPFSLYSYDNLKSIFDKLALGHSYDVNKQLIIDGNSGNIGIGILPTNYKLEVNGSVKFNDIVKIYKDLEVNGTVRLSGLVKISKKLEAQEIEVKNVTLPDYVFESNYNLRSLNEVEHFISQNKHLPEVPSAKQVAQDGMNLVEMNNAMLKKIEELTLYLIEQNKRIDVLEKQNNELLQK
ncbi:MAG: hypothetical protein IPO21_07445 [Bacteroidales bacterium]|nr:hypothetical protein [Bacteroidales bacterium]